MAFEKHGRSLETALKNGPLPIARVRRVTHQILTALERLHRCGFAHTDIKPHNILYDPLTGDARLADLGSATDRLHQGDTFGTREYLAPEAIIGAPLRVEMDMWSLGCTVFEMLSGRLLFSRVVLQRENITNSAARRHPLSSPRVSSTTTPKNFLNRFIGAKSLPGNTGSSANWDAAVSARSGRHERSTKNRSTNPTRRSAGTPNPFVGCVAL
jgi:serine/threonine protein kinase